MFRKRTKSEVQTDYTCSVRFLDDEPMQFTFKRDTIGQWLLDRVAEKLNLLEKDYFGLRYIDTEKQRHWLDPLKTVYKQLRGVSPMVLCFRVKFYPEEPMRLHEEITRYFMFLQLRRDLHHGRLLCSPDDAVYLAAYIVQSEVGDYLPEDHPPGYISEFKMLPKQTPKLEERVMEQHRALQGQTPADSEGNFLKRACSLDTYGVDPHQVKDQKGEHLYLGITHQGIMTFRGSRRTQLYKWAQIRRLSYEGKMFIVNVSVNEEGNSGPSKKKQQPVTYKCQAPSGAKHLWRCAVEQQLFFTLASASTAPKMRSGGTLFSRGSKFRFSGRCQMEAKDASERIHRQQPYFPRSSSLPNFARRHGSSSNRSSAVIGQRDSSLLDDSLTEEAAIDVPSGLATPTRHSQTDSASVTAPLAPEELYDEHSEPNPPEVTASAVTELITAASAVTTATAMMPQMNGQAITDTSEVRGPEVGEDSMMSYNPSTTVYHHDDDDSQETSVMTPVEEDMHQSHATQASAEQPHLTASIPSSPTVMVRPARKSSGVCGAVVMSLVVSLVLFAVLFYVVFFSGWRHPTLTQARQHLGFLEPARDLVVKHSQQIVAYFK